MTSPVVSVLRISAQFGRLVLALAATVSSSLVFAQAVVPPRESTKESAAAIELSPFIVSTEKDQGYQAQNTLSGSRLNSSLANTPVAIQVLTRELLLDLNATSYEDYLNFATNAKRDFSDATGLASVQQGVAPSQVNIRGFNGVAITRDFFLSQTASDRFSVDRYEVSRGPNSILFGIGGPGGVVNTNSKFALIDSNQKDEVRSTVGSWSNNRVEADFNRTLIDGKLAARVNGLWEDREGWRDFEFAKRIGVAFATTYRPWRNTQLRLNYEYMDTKQNQAYPFPSSDFSGAWIAAGKPVASGPIFESSTPAPAGTLSATNDALRYAPQVGPNIYRYGDSRVVDSNPNLPGNQPVRFFETTNAPNPSNAPAAGFPAFINFDVLPQSANLAGPGNTSDNNYGFLTALLEQRVGPFAVELGYNRQIDKITSGFAVNWNAIGIRGDANPQLPGYYLPTGTLGANPPGQLIANSYAPNPFVGKFYVESQAAFRIQKRDSENLRATISADLDLTKRSKWLGNHRFAGLLQRAEVEYYTDIFSELNTTRDNALSLNAGQNQIIRRTYLDFGTPGGVRGALDPFANPINSPGVNPAFLRTGRTNRNTVLNDAYMGVMQSSFLNDYLVLTLGLRRDKQDTHQASGGVLLPVTDRLGGTWTEDTVYDPAVGKSSIAGNTQTLGAVLRPVKWGALVFNSSNSIRPAAGIDLFGRPLGLQEGVGKDFGVRFFLFENRVNLGVTAYNTGNKKAVFDGITTRTQVLPVINGIYQSFTDAGVAAKYRSGSFTADFRDTVDSDGDGVEVELTANPTQRWRVSMNYSQPTVKVANVQPIMNGLLAAESPFWRQNAGVRFVNRDGNLESYVRARDGTPARDFVANPPTVGDAQQFVQAAVGILNLQEGQLPLQFQKESFNFFNSYSFPKLPLVGERFTAGFGASYRSAAVVGYNNFKPIYGKSFIIWNGMMRKRFMLGSGRSLDLQLNVNNLFKQEDLLPYTATPSGVLRYFFQRQRQSWALQAALTF